MPDSLGTIEVHLVDVVSFQKVADIIEAAKLMAAALEAVEWVPCDEMIGQKYCPSCGVYEPNGHASTCKREVSLAAWKDITKGVE